MLLEEKLVIHPHEGVAKVQLTLSNNESPERYEYLGLVIERVEIRPITLETPEYGKEAAENLPFILRPF